MPKQENCSVLLKAEFNINGTNSLRAGQTCPISFVARGIYASHHFTPHGRYELNKFTSLPMCGFIAQLVEQRTSNAEVTRSNPVEARIFFFRLLLSNFLNWKIYCNDHS